MVTVASRAATDEGFAKPGEALVIAASTPFGRAGTTNLVKVAWVE